MELLYESNNYLCHWGIKGMKWGVRRKKPHADYTKAHTRKNVKYMSDQELRERNNRLNMEVQHRDLKSKSRTGKRLVNAYIAGGATIAGIMTATAAYKKIANHYLSKANVGSRIANSVTG